MPDLHQPCLSQFAKLQKTLVAENQSAEAQKSELAKAQKQQLAKAWKPKDTTTVYLHTQTA